MKKFFSINRRVIEILVTLLLVFIAAGYYYLIYIPSREDEIIARRFRTLQRIERNIQEKFQGYMAMVKNCLSQANNPEFKKLVDSYNSEHEKFFIRIVRNETHKPKNKTIRNKVKTQGSGDKSNFQFNYDTAYSMLTDSGYVSVKPVSSGNMRKISLRGCWYLLQKNGSIKYVELEAIIDYREFIAPLLKINVFDQYIVFNYRRDSSTVVFETFPSGISFNNIDSLFDAKEKVYSSRVIKIETGGLKYLAFLHPCGYSSKNERIIAGLYREDEFNREKQKLPDSLVTSFLFIALFCFLLMPFLRLAIMGKKDRMRVFDVTTVYLSFLLLIPSFVLVFLWNRNQFVTGEPEGSNSKEILAEKISANLTNEISASYDLLDHIDNLYNNDLKLKILREERVSYIGDAKTRNSHENKEIKKFDIKSNYALSHLDSLVLPDNNKCKNLQLVFWMDKKGKEVANWSYTVVPPPGNYKDRVYFKNASAANLLTLPGDTGKSCAIDPIISRTDGKFKIIIAKLSRDTSKVVAASSLLSSVINPILPLGFMFSIVDASGNTIFDSDSSSNLNENLLEELSDPSDLKTVLQTNTKREFQSRFKETEYKILAQPVKGLPWYIVIYQNTIFNDSLNTQSFSFTMLMMLWVFLVLCFEIIIVIATSSGKSKLVKNKVDLLWLQPKKSMAGDYLFLIVFNVCLFVFTLTYCYYSFSINKVTEYVILFTLLPLLTALATLHYRTPGFKNHIIAISVLFLLLGFILCGFFYYGWDVYKGPIMLLGISVILYFFLPFFIPLKDSESFVTRYSLVIISRAMLTSALPVFFFFKCIAIFEHRLQERMVLLDFAHKIETQTKNFTDLDKLISAPERIKGTACYMDLDWINCMDSSGQPVQVNTTRFSRTDTSNIFLLKAGRLHNDDTMMQEANLGLVQPIPDSLYAFNKIFSGNASFLQYTIQKMDGMVAKKKTINLYSSGNFICSCPPLSNFPKGFFFWFLLIGALVFCFRLLLFAVKKIFATDITDGGKQPVWNRDLLCNDCSPFVFVHGMQDTRTGEIIKNMLSTEPGLSFFDKENPVKDYNAVVINLSYNSIYEEVGKDEKTVEQLEKPKPVYFSNMLVVSGASGSPIGDPWSVDPGKMTMLKKPGDISIIDDEKVRLVLFTNFEYNLVNPSIILQNLKRFERLSREGKKKIIITSSVTPGEFIKSLERFDCTPGKMAASNDSNKKQAGDALEEEGKLKCAEIMSRWNYFFGNFVILQLNKLHYLHFGKNILETNHNGKECPGSACGLFEDDAWLGKNKRKAENPMEDYEVINQQKLFSQRYLSVWKSLTHEEQFLLIDLAEDGLVNTVNYMVLEELVERGLIYRDDGVLHIVNASFRNFILTAFSSGDIKTIQADITGGSSWNDYKYPVLIVLGSLVYFVLTSNPEKFGNVLPYITGITAGIPTIIKVLSYIKPSAGKT